MKGKENLLSEGKKEKDSKNLYQGKNQDKAQKEMKNFSVKALKIQKKIKDNSEEDTPQLVRKLFNFKTKRQLKEWNYLKN
jgi:hypothetical protein